MELHLLSCILWYDSAAYQLSLYIQWDPGRALKCQGLSMKRLCAIYPKTAFSGRLCYFFAVRFHGCNSSFANRMPQAGVA